MDTNEAIPPITDEDLELLLGDIVEAYGYDFSAYAWASLKRRVTRLFSIGRFASFAELRHRIRTDREYLPRFIEEITVNVTEMFRDPSFFRALKQEIFPALSTYPFIRIWHAGCSTGEEVYSMAIMLHEANLLHRAVIYATDISPAAVKQAASGLVPIRHMKQYARNYIEAGGINDFSAYYTASNNQVLFRDELRKHMVFSTHNLASETSFNQFQLICCRNVLIYFNSALQERVFNLFDQSLERFGFLALGSKESMRAAQCYNRYKQISKQKIWRKIA
ncbi:chemotaxis protein methyltransferase CheR [Parapedobacter composti]|uniref:Chemotaxis protein methyltransferase CheR n=1 Tax=Parapedobacter composti TaxID=623281 RepID=A0A1I1IDF0_9SPHI|nr:protein-glutamate O-methyltransferase CheR [Parapedobacter composti]SFC34327.1 chemotaxis protein methyltransferase CheR [Parapedobacter composti]